MVNKNVVLWKLLYHSNIGSALMVRGFDFFKVATFMRLYLL